MMAYGNSFVLAVLHDGHPVREINGKVSVPFHSEYKIRLKNKHSSLRAKARVWVDGRKASNLGDFILKPGETLDLERFLDSDLNSGNKFKFVPLSDSRVNDPTDPDNGVIKVEFYREKQFDIEPLPIRPKPWVPVKPFTPFDDWGTGGTNNDSDPPWTYTAGCNTAGKSCSSFSPVNINYVADVNGATVEGGLSNQVFVYSTDFATEVFPVTLTLKIKGLASGPFAEISRTPVKSKKKKKRFCAHCGRRRSRMADKFCPRCGNPY